VQNKAEGRKVLEKTPTLFRCVSCDLTKRKCVVKETELTEGSKG